MYMGSADKDIRCIITGSKGFVSLKCPIRGTTLINLVEFDHIRKKLNPTKTTCPGTSIDKSRRSTGTLIAPSDLFRTYKLNEWQNKVRMYEFMAMMPLSVAAHKLLSYGSSYADMTLKDFDKCYGKDSRPWVIRNAANFNKFRDKYDLGNITYTWFINHLSNIDHAPIFERIVYVNP